VLSHLAFAQRREHVSSHAVFASHPTQFVREPRSFCDIRAHGHQLVANSLERAQDFAMRSYRRVQVRAVRVHHAIQ